MTDLAQRVTAARLTPELGVVAAAGVALPLALLAARWPLAVGLGLAAVVVVAVCIFVIELAVLLVVASAPIEAAVTLGPPQLTITKITGAICFASFALYAVRGNRRLRFERGQAIVLGILAVALLSTAFAADEVPTAFAAATRYASFAGIYIVVSQLVGRHAAHRRIAWVLSIASTASAVLGMVEYFSSRQPIATLAYENSNDFAFVIATTLPLTFWLLGCRRWLRPFVAQMIGVQCAGILLSLSRGALVGIAAGFFFLLLTDRRRIPHVLAGGLAAAVAALLVIQSDPARFHEAISLKQRVAEYNVTTRLDAWRVAGELAVDHPLLGIGPGNFQFEYPRIAGIPPGTHAVAVAHDAYLDIAAELGVVAMILFLLYIALAFGRLTAAARLGLGLPGYAQALRVSLVIAAFCSVFLSEQYFLPFWLIGGLAAAISLERGEERAGNTSAEPDEEARGRPSPPPLRPRLVRGS